MDSKRSRASWGVIAALWAVLAAAASGSASAAPVETVLYPFSGGTDGSYPAAGLIFNSQGNLYGTTSSGGANGYGTVYELIPASDGGWTETVLYNFCSLANCSDGSRPVAGLILDSKGNLYGTTANGGGSGCSASGPGGCGTVFELTRTGGGVWNETVLHTFSGYPSDGAIPLAGLIADSRGNMYGTTSLGGANGYGTVFELTPAGVETVLFNFCFTPKCSYGIYPQAGLLADSKGNLYGTTLEGGNPYGYGTVFELSPPAITGGAWNVTVLYAFNDGSAGEYPLAGLVADTNGNLYGTTNLAGTASAGAVFELSPPAIAGGAWILTVPHAFKGGSDGGNSYAGLIADMNGNLYGTTGTGGNASNSGTVFELTPATGGGWTKRVLYNFCSLLPCTDGGISLAGLLADSKGNLYGTTTVGGGASNAGTVFELTTGTGFVPPVPFAAFSGQLAIQFGTAPNTDVFELLSSFTLGSASNGINPPAETVTLQVGTFTTTIPPFSFTGLGSFAYIGVIDGVNLELSITPTGTKRYALDALVTNASLTGTVNPVPVTLTIGADTGTVSITAVFANGGLAAAHLP
ncbi:MAG: choice-of-anchor tandem repeat GloVer-containing protein [Methylocella sp.]